MGTFAAAYMAVWLAVVLYVARLDTRQRRLSRDLRSLELQFDRLQSPENATSKAA